MLKDSETTGAKRVMEALMRMKKIDLAELERAFGRERVTA
jgi:predicted 3-demethylubiquinone-9 3-methyltransferase (glyoxalase superfamily)